MNGRFLFLLPLLLLSNLCSAQKRSPLKVPAPQVKFYRIDSTAGGSAAMQALLAPYKVGTDTLMKVGVARIKGVLTKAQPESTLGNLVADAQLAAAQKIDPKVVAAVSNYGGLRLQLIVAGPVQRETLFELMPFENTVCIVEIPGSILQHYCNTMARRRGWPVAGIRYVIEDTLATHIEIDGQPLNPVLVYKLALNDYNAKGGDGCDFLKPLRKKTTVVLIRDAIISYLSEYEARGVEYVPTLDGRVRYAHE